MMQVRLLLILHIAHLNCAKSIAQGCAFLTFHSLLCSGLLTVPSCDDLPCWKSNNNIFVLDNEDEVRCIVHSTSFSVANGIMLI